VGIDEEGGIAINTSVRLGAYFLRDLAPDFLAPLFVPALFLLPEARTVRPFRPSL